ncbi:YbgF trimerization domain-containing protein [Sphingomonas sp. BK580]|uniref:YbgF trimerization domain-containing protein n=1 Tax=Sphingomonas sp. BK580 TaxID=2586972 RepID=UPI00160AAACF|nr:tetratricopeptide repeat protein [Sphingomonas sp. BK580]MBB3694088.1 TolA-binding protein [Sphingomonas sp. BK580]
MTKWMAGSALALVVAGSIATPAAAQIEGRVGKLEAEMRAVQRKVFPGGVGAMVEPQIAPSTAPVDAAGVPATSALTDITARVTSLEQQMASMTGQIEQTQYKLRQLEQQFEDYRKATDAKLTQPVAPAPTPGADAAGGPAVTVPQAPEPVNGGAAAGAAAPSSADPAEDAYLAGYRLWQSRDYPAAEAQLKKVVATYPKHRRASFAQNLLGRAYLDEGKPSLASIAFYDNYKKFPDGERAPDSLYYLGTALLKLDKPADACKVYGELTDVYGDKISPGLKADVAKARTAAKCK